tara:strand:- start:852 stop:1310 length:459 start_codon:yes stop_codon:yes gene_type:complete
MAAKKAMKKPQMGMGEQAALKPKFLKGILTKDDGSMTTFGNIANIWGGGVLGQIKSGLDMFRGGAPAMHSKKPLQSRRMGVLARMKKRQIEYAKAVGQYGPYDPSTGRADSLSFLQGMDPGWKIKNKADNKTRGTGVAMQKKTRRKVKAKKK